MPTMEQLMSCLNPQHSHKLDHAVNDSLVTLAFEFPEYPFETIAELRSILIVMYHMAPEAADVAIARYQYADAT